MTTNGASPASGGRKPEKATIRNLENQKEFEVMFNPTEYSLSKSNTWTQVSIRESNVPRTYFSSLFGLESTGHFQDRKESRTLAPGFGRLQELTGSRCHGGVCWGT